MSASLVRSTCFLYYTVLSLQQNKTFQEKLDSITVKVENWQVSSFPFLDSLISENEIKLTKELDADIKEQCEHLIAGV
jgi:hypothetical protein